MFGCLVEHPERSRRIVCIMSIFYEVPITAFILVKRIISRKGLRLDESFKLVYKEEFLTRLDSMRREKQLKGWTRTKLELLKKL